MCAIPLGGLANAASSDVDPLIVGGTTTTTEANPWTVAVFHSNREHCGGTLIAPNKVVTAAHCTDGDPASRFSVVAGRTDMRTTKGVVAKVTKYWQHPSYRSVEQGDDVAVLTLDRNLEQKTLPLVTAADTGLYRAGTVTTTLGWGDIRSGGPSSPVLRKVDVPLTSDATCKSAYGEYNATSMVCAGLPAGGKDSCQGDSGGPLVTAGKLVGVVSWGEGCAQAGKPGVYARVISYLDLIKQQLR
ncbi:S1 family peptidase [Crossiella sp. CA198]|uniref:S1 family peptidase n=1 Tax=Crossiella sp. CA198 TaxID=3455607 RepID=UPI003F8D4B7B